MRHSAAPRVRSTSSHRNCTRTGIGGEEVLVLLTQVSDVAAAGSLEVVGHAVVEGENTGGRANLGTHVADGGHAWTAGRMVLKGWSEVMSRDDTLGTSDRRI